MENIFEIEESSSEEESEDETIDRISLSSKLLNRFPTKQYEKNRNKLFTKSIVKKRIVIDSQSYYFGPMPGHSVSKSFAPWQEGEEANDEGAFQQQGFQSVNFSSSNYTVPLELKRNVSILGLPTPSFTADHGIFNNVIGFKLKKAIIRVPTYNVNKTNNVITYIPGFGDGFTAGSAIKVVTINPGVYTAHELADVFQRYKNNEYPNQNDLFDPALNAQFCVYSTINTGQFYDEYEQEFQAIGSGSWASSTEFTPHPNSFTCKFKEKNANDIGRSDDGLGGFQSFKDFDAPDFDTSTNYYRGMGFEFGFPGHHPHPDSSGQAVTIIWNYNSVTRGAAKLFGFLPQTRVAGLHQYSNKAPDMSSQFVDLVIPQIPSIACTKNSNGKDIIERIPLNAPHGEFVYYIPREEESEIQNYFSPIRLSKIQIQLFSWNDEFYDSQNSDNSFEFEITMVKDKNLLG